MGLALYCHLSLSRSLSPAGCCLALVVWEGRKWSNHHLSLCLLEQPSQQREKRLTQSSTSLPAARYNNILSLVILIMLIPTLYQSKPGQRNPVRYTAIFPRVSLYSIYTRRKQEKLILPERRRKKTTAWDLKGTKNNCLLLHIWHGLTWRHTQHTKC